MGFPSSFATPIISRWKWSAGTIRHPYEDYLSRRCDLALRCEKEAGRNKHSYQAVGSRSFSSNGSGQLEECKVTRPERRRIPWRARFQPWSSLHRLAKAQHQAPQSLMTPGGPRVPGGQKAKTWQSHGDPRSGIAGRHPRNPRTMTNAQTIHWHNSCTIYKECGCRAPS